MRSQVINPEKNFVFRKLLDPEHIKKIQHKSKLLESSQISDSVEINKVLISNSSYFKIVFL